MTTEQKTRRWTMADIRAANKASGLHFFDRSTMRHWRSRIEGGPYQGPGGVFFVTSERGAHDDSPRRFTVREWRAEKCRIHTLGEFQGFHTRDDARQAAKDAAKPPTLPVIPVIAALRSLAVGESCIVGPCKPNAVSAAFTHSPGTYTQFRVIVTEPRSARSVPMFCVTRKS